MGNAVVSRLREVAAVYGVDERREMNIIVVVGRDAFVLPAVPE